MSQKKISWEEVVKLPLEDGIFEWAADDLHLCARIKKIHLVKDAFIIFTKSEAIFDPKYRVWTLLAKVRYGMLTYCTTKIDDILPTAGPAYLQPDRSVTFYSKKAGFHTIYPKGARNQALERALHPR